jgi:hypothetical protein
LRGSPRDETAGKHEKIRRLRRESRLENKVWLTRFMALDLSGSYLRAHVGKGTWKMEGLEILNSPETNLGGPSAKLGLIFGS